MFGAMRRPLEMVTNQIRENQSQFQIAEGSFLLPLGGGGGGGGGGGRRRRGEELTEKILAEIQKSSSTMAGKRQACLTALKLARCWSNLSRITLHSHYIHVALPSFARGNSCR